MSGPPAHVSGAPVQGSYTPPHGYAQPGTTPPHGYAQPVSGAGSGPGHGPGGSAPAGVGFAHPQTPVGHWAAVPTAPHHTVSNAGTTGTVYTGGAVPAVEPLQPPGNRDGNVIPVWNVADAPRPGVVENRAAEAAPPTATTTRRRSPVKLIVAGVVAAWILIAAVVIVWNLPGDPDTKVPNVAGVSQDTAATQLKAAKLAVGTITYEDSTDVPENMIIRTDPAADKRVDEGTKVTLVLARAPGTTPLVLPDLANKTQAEATAGLTSVGLLAGEVTSEPSSTVGEGLVIRTEPAANTPVPPGATIKLILASRPTGQTQQTQPCHVPDVLHKPRDHAEQAMKNANVPYQIKKEDSDHVAVGTVISTDPGAGRLEQCRKVTIVVSQGVPIHVPDVVGDPEGYAKQQIVDAKLKASVKYSSYCGAAENQEAVVKTQSPGGGSTLHEGDTVTITIPKYTGPCASNKTTNDDVSS
jgi:beta-lactam-binding protein with PASTA domain